jgi:hypothetical protein
MCNEQKIKLTQNLNKNKSVSILWHEIKIKEDTKNWEIWSRKSSMFKSIFEHMVSLNINQLSAQ